MRRHQRLTVAAAGALVAAALAVGTPPISAAVEAPSSQLVLRDGAGDVWKFYPDTERSVRLANFPRADVLRTVVRHGDARLRIRMRFADIRRVGTQLYWVHIRTRLHQYDAVLTSEPGARRGRRYFQGDDGSRSCEGFARSIRYADDVVRFSIPRECVQEPRWVQVGIFNQLSFRDRGPRYFDTPFNHESPATNAVESRRLYAG